MKGSRLGFLFVCVFSKSEGEECICEHISQPYPSLGHDVRSFLAGSCPLFPPPPRKERKGLQLIRTFNFPSFFIYLFFLRLK